MHAIFQILLVLSAVFTGYAAPEFDKFLLKLDDGISQSSTGYIFRPSATDYSSKQAVDRSIDIPNKRFRTTNGNKNESNYQQVFTFSNSTSALLYDHGGLACLDFPAPLTFNNIVGAYAHPYVRYLGLASLGDQVYKMYVGLSPDTVANANVSNVMFVHSTNNAVVFHAILNQAGFNYFLLPKVTLGNPNYAWFTLPTECKIDNATLCDPPCGKNAQCNSSKCECLNGYTGNPSTECTATTTEFDAGVTTYPYDQFVLDKNSDAKSQTCNGTYVDPITNTRQHSAWIQDIEGQKFRFDVGKPGEEGAVSYLFTSEGSYTVKYGGNSLVTCSQVDTKYTFAHIFNDTFYPTLRYLGDTTYNNVSCRMYAGVGRLHNPSGEKEQGIIKYIAKDGSQFPFMALLNNQGYTYFDFSDTIMGKPDDAWFQKETLCASKSGAGALRQINSYFAILVAGVLIKYFA